MCWTLRRRTVAFASCVCVVEARGWHPTDNTRPPAAGLHAARSLRDQLASGGAQQDDQAILAIKVSAAPPCPVRGRELLRQSTMQDAQKLLILRHPRKSGEEGPPQASRYSLSLKAEPRR
eukprot:7382668-Prymnesium_polylepis.3